jgi:hypothetical protein
MENADAGCNGSRKGAEPWPDARRDKERQYADTDGGHMWPALPETHLARRIADGLENIRATKQCK